METPSKAEVIKPILLKVGISLSLSVAGFICARIISRRSMAKESSCSLETQVNSLETDSRDGFKDEASSFYSFPSTCIEEDEEPTVTDAKFQEILGLRSRIKDLEKREWELEMHFIRYCELKEKESMLMELRNKLSLEMARVEFLDREISSIEEENKWLENLVLEYMRVLEQSEYWKSENGLLGRKVKKLLRRRKEKSRVIREQNMEIAAREAEILRNCDVLETRANVIKKLEDEVRELLSIVDQLQEEKNGLVEKFELTEKSASSISKIEGEGITIEAYNKLVNEMEELQKDRQSEIKEVIFLRWSNACLRHELMRRSQQQQLEQQQNEKNNHSDLCLEGCQEIGNSLDHELDNLVLEHNNEPSFGVESSDHACNSKRRKLLQRLRRWVEGSDKGREKPDEKKRHDIKCLGRHSVSDGAEEHLNARLSCSSA